jgi:ubiquinone/menaquinone biosynthesis C-methylase UbiE
VSTTEDYRKASHETWQAMARGWDERRSEIWDASRAVGERLVERLDPQPGDAVLELAAGVGDTGFAAAARVGPGGRLISTDFASGMVDAARRRGEELGLANVEYRVMDAERMELPDNSVDGVLCRWGYMLMADSAAALRETRRVLRAGGRLCFSVWGPPERNPWAAIPGRVLVERGHMPPPEQGMPGIFAMADRTRIQQLVTVAGFGEPEIEEVEMAWRFPDFDAWWAFTNDLAGALAMAIAELPEAEREAVRSDVRERAGLRADEGYDLPGLCLNVTTG